MGLVFLEHLPHVTRVVAAQGVVLAARGAEHRVAAGQHQHRIVFAVPGFHLEHIHSIIVRRILAVVAAVAADGGLAAAEIKVGRAHLVQGLFRRPEQGRPHHFVQIQTVGHLVVGSPGGP
jgi:hypothetical protein